MESENLAMPLSSFKTVRCAPFKSCSLRGRGTALFTDRESEKELREALGSVIGGASGLLGEARRSPGGEFVPKWGPYFVYRLTIIDLPSENP